MSKTEDTDETDERSVYQKAAQQLILFDEMVIHERQAFGRPLARFTAKDLYDEHGPFELEFDEDIWCKGSPSWYDYE